MVTCHEWQSSQCHGTARCSTAVKVCRWVKFLTKIFLELIWCSWVSTSNWDPEPGTIIWIFPSSSVTTTVLASTHSDPKDNALYLDGRDSCHSQICPLLLVYFAFIYGLDVNNVLTSVKSVSYFLCWCDWRLLAEVRVNPYVFSSSNMTPFVQPNPDCTVYSPPPPYFPGFSASYCGYNSCSSELSRTKACGMHV
jgi:hypothetical protein